MNRVDLYYILNFTSLKRKDFALLFWSESSCNLTVNVIDAKIFTEKEVNKFFPNKTFNCNKPIPVMEILPLCESYIVDNILFGKIVKNDIANQKALNIPYKDLEEGSFIDRYRYNDPRSFLKNNERFIKLCNNVKSYIEETKR